MVSIFHAPPNNVVNITNNTISIIAHSGSEELSSRSAINRGVIYDFFLINQYVSLPLTRVHTPFTFLPLRHLHWFEMQVEYEYLIIHSSVVLQVSILPKRKILLNQHQVLTVKFRKDGKLSFLNSEVKYFKY